MLRVFLIHVYLPPSIPQIKKQNYLKCNVLSTRKSLAAWFEQGLRASSLQFTSPLEFNAIFRDGFTLRLDLTAGSKIRDPVTAKFKHARLL